ncbi:hypothetical protein HanRHA438_Chr14g0644161 [Helianthus annuus]|uniref:Uncharacterized protein n=1 Tax=Helianthus annuus TaxID=4232 RepID=A0A251SF49_HELAN|nr:hypothetical protein HanXRQr2_Chr14g0633241 [Helianthus annuus]KAJ0484961.1 hypothetical protein HanHA89_Chr14g0562761 [Helianthus annuus]KAJ0655512.1 hypothetical protein HanLR1_Chr14g0525101 [Helianthus annuus]KAJ0839482.1 hypothetical protein HanPSC8_Chr14g0607351 [Helianthus annuus]KAJ0852827.1 hypothetical protein HanRHA438_Chr14g0644161 [Helianthus annuus]
MTGAPPASLLLHRRQQHPPLSGGGEQRATTKSEEPTRERKVPERRMTATVVPSSIAAKPVSSIGKVRRWRENQRMREKSPMTATLQATGL